MLIKDRVKFDSERKYTPEGFLFVPAKIARVGIQEYYAVELGVTDVAPDKILKIYRDEVEVFNVDSLNSFANKPVTDDHPPVLVNSTNAKQFAVGMSGEKITKDGDYVKAELYITDAETIKKIENGKVELSNGYTADVDMTAGITQNGESYDGVQRNIKGNHIAIVDNARAGSNCKLADNINKGDFQKMKIAIDGVDYEVTDQVAQAVEKLKSKAEDMEEEKKKAEDELEEVKKKAEDMEEEKKKTEDALKAKLDSLKDSQPTLADIDEKVNAKMKLVDNIRKLTPDVDWVGKDSATLKKEVVAKLCPNVQVDSVSKEYIDARFDILLENGGTNALDKSLQSALADGGNKKVEKIIDSEKARQAMIERNKNLWKKGAK